MMLSIPQCTLFELINIEEYRKISPLTYNMADLNLYYFVNAVSSDCGVCTGDSMLHYTLEAYARYLDGCHFDPSIERSYRETALRQIQ
jgi:hypothetical protein